MMETMEWMEQQEHSANRVRRNTLPELNARIDRKMRDRVRYYATQPCQVLDERIEELEQEWDTERVLAANTAALALSGLVLGLFRNRVWLLMPAVVLPLLFQHATRGWCPSLAVIRRFGVRTRQEIDAEKYALKALRGDFDAVACEPEAQGRANQALAAV